MQAEAAETVALRALGWLAAEEDLLGVFLGSSGASVDDIRDRAGDPEFLGAVLDFILMDDAWVLGFAEANDLHPDTVFAARQALPGGDLPNWT